MALAHKLNLPVVATNNVRFLLREDFDAHEARVCIHGGNILADPRRPKKYTEQQYFRTQAEMVALFADLPAALENTVEIAAAAPFILTLGKNYLHAVMFRQDKRRKPGSHKWQQKDLKHALQKTACPPEKKPDYADRLATELDVINRMGFAGYFLIVADFTRWARQNGVRWGQAAAQALAHWWRMHLGSQTRILWPMTCCLNGS